MKQLSIDIETFSGADLGKVGVYKYAESPDFEVLLFAYAWGSDPVKVVDFTAGEALPDDVFNALTDPGVLKAAFNANFERVCLSHFFHLSLTAEQWDCTRVRALTAGLPSSLKGAGAALGIDKAKMDEGAGLIRKFCMPCKPSRANGERTRWRPGDAPEDWAVFKKYCARDVEAEREIRERLNYVEYTNAERELYVLDQKINDTGVRIDRPFVEAAIADDTASAAATLAKAQQLTGLSNPGSVSQMKEWLKEQLGRDVPSLTKAVVAELIHDDATPAKVKEALQYRQRLGKTSVAKYQKMKDVAGEGDRIRGLFQFYGANRTGRFAGRLVQLQNLPRNSIEPLDLLRRLVRQGDADLVEAWFMPLPVALSQLVRTALVASPGNVLTVSDFSAIEARVIAWLAGETWRNEVFATHGKIYEASAAQMFHVPMESITKGSELRQKGKVAELACGYGGGVGALKAMGADKMGLSDNELQDIITRWRAKSPRIVRLWSALEDAAKMAIKTRDTVRIRQGITMSATDNFLRVFLPSGRCLYYAEPTVEPVAKFGKFIDTVTYMGVNQATNKWERQDTYGGKLTENVVQAIARDCLGEAMRRVDRQGYRIVAHVHDEIIIDGPRGILGKVNEIMAEPIDWAPGLRLRGDGYETEYYRKD